jgi:hypothetical protein
MKKAIVAAFVLALALSTLAFAGCGDSGGDSSDNPEQVVEKFLAASMNGDADAAYELITEQSKEDVTDKEELVEGFSEGLDSYEVGKGSISGDRASVPVKFQLTGLDMEIEFNIILLKEDGSWKISGPDTDAETEKALEELYEEMEVEVE